MLKPFPLNKCMNPADREELQAEVQIVEAYQTVEGQHEARWWEYAMAHRAIRDWTTYYWDTNPTATDRDAPRMLCDVGGAGSKFATSLINKTSEDILVIDPLPQAKEYGRVLPYCGTVEQYAATARHSQFDCLTAISVVEHLEEFRTFFRACHMLLKPGGLLFLTTDCWDKEGKDVAHFHWMRKRIYNPEGMKRLAGSVRELGFQSFGKSMWAYYGPTVYDYSFASLALVKK